MKILIIKPSSFGDVIQAFSCANALKQAYPGCKISWVIFSQWKDIVELCGDIDNVIQWNRHGGLKEFFRVLKSLRNIKYDLVIDLQGLLRSALLTRLLKAKVKIGVPGMKELSNLLVNEVYPKNAKMNATLRNLEPVRFITGKTFKPQVNIEIDTNTAKQAQDILASNKVSQKFVVLLPFARGKGKDWSIDNYQKFISMFKEKYSDMDVVVLGVKKDFGKIKSVIDLCGQTDLKQLAAIIQRSKIAIGADTGSMHLATALNVPSIFIFGKSDINETAPYLGKFSLLINKENHKDLNKISPTEVLMEVKKWEK